MQLPPITLADIDREIERRRYDRLSRFWATPEQRKGYDRHLETIAATADYRVTCFMAANRCITPWTYLSNNRLALSTVCEQSFDVQSWDGERQCNAQAQEGYVKGILPAFRVVLDNNQFFDCTDEHLVLTSEGYLSLRQLMSRASGLRLTRKREDYQASCVEDGYLCDPRLLSGKDTALELFQEQADVQEPCQKMYWTVDEVGHISQYIRTSQESCRLSSQDDLQRHAALFAPFLAAFYDTPFVRLSDEHSTFLQSLPALSQNELNALIGHNPSFLRGLVSWQESFALASLDILFPLNHPQIVGGRTIKSVVPLGLQPIIDFHVPIYNNYLAGGVYHHNSGKSETGAYACAVWLTGRYPDWWRGKRFGGAVNALAAGETGKLVRDSMQVKLLGHPGAHGTGMIPRDCIVSTRPKPGIPDAIDTVRVRHANGDESVLQFQSYDQGREAFQATERNIIWEDEEPPHSVHNENLIRTMTTGGIVLLTFTPLKGISETVLHMQSKAEEGLVKIIQATWDDAPHLTDEAKKQLWASLPPYQRDARSKGIPQLGSGAIYPVQEQDYVVAPFEIPESWKVCYGLDVGWNNTAAVWAAHDLENDVVYIYRDYKRGQSEPAVHSAAIKAAGEMPGAIDPASRGRAQADGEQLIELYRQQGLNLVEADNAVEAGIYAVYERLTTGRLKIFSTCHETISEMRLYRRDEKGRVVKQNDHCMDAKRYAIMTGLDNAVYKSETAAGKIKRRAVRTVTALSDPYAW